LPQADFRVHRLKRANAVLQPFPNRQIARLDPYPVIGLAERYAISASPSPSPRQIRNILTGHRHREGICILAECA
jgi:hypothetical protein